MNNYKITIQYDGTRYKGWQGQNSTGLTIQGKIEAVLGQMAGHAVEVIGSGRTDAGVHAKGQVANFHIEEHFTEGKILSYLNHYLPVLYSLRSPGFCSLRSAAAPPALSCHPRPRSAYPSGSAPYFAKIHSPGNRS